MNETLIWAAVVFIPVMTVVLRLVPAAQRAITVWTDAHAATSTERAAAVQETLTGIAERRHALALREATIAEETAARRAGLAADEQRHETDREAASQVLGEAVEARKRVIAARAQAEAELAPEVARAALASGDTERLRSLTIAYATYCKECRNTTPLTFAQWIEGFAGLPPARQL